MQRIFLIVAGAVFVVVFWLAVYLVVSEVFGGGGNDVNGGEDYPCVQPNRC